MEDYKEKYEQALEKAKFLKENTDGVGAKDVSRCFELIFPELKESKDERIRKALIKLVEMVDKNPIGQIFGYGDITYSDMLDWLEKQGKIIDEYEDKLDRCACENFDKGYKAALEKQSEQNSADKVEPKFKVGDIIRLIHNELNNLQVECKITRIDDKFYYSEYEDGTEVIMFGLPAQDAWELVKQKPTDKAEPKFHKGEWIVWQNKCYKVNYNGCGYELIDQNGLRTSLEYETVDNSGHLWTIQDAKDSDVLVASDGSIFLFAGVDDCACKYYAVLTNDNNIKINKEVKGGYWETSRAVHPATKEQRDTLMKAMTDAGYTFDFENKELKKIS